MKAHVAFKIPKDIRESMPVEDIEAKDVMLTSDAECPGKQELKPPSANMSNAVLVQRESPRFSRGEDVKLEETKL